MCVCVCVSVCLSLSLSISLSLSLSLALSLSRSLSRSLARSLALPLSRARALSLCVCVCVCHSTASNADRPPRAPMRSARSRAVTCAGLDSADAYLKCEGISAPRSRDRRHAVSLENTARRAATPASCASPAAHGAHGAHAPQDTRACAAQRSARGASRAGSASTHCTAGCRPRCPARAPAGAFAPRTAGRAWATHDCAKARMPPVPVAAAALVECCRRVCCSVTDRARICARICWSPARSPAKEDMLAVSGFLPPPPGHIRWPLRPTRPLW